jgi:transcriptional regulator with XRE-family HTH domain
MSRGAIGRLPALHARIRRRRLERSLTGTDLAVRAGISTSYVSLIENGAKVPDEEVAARLARALDDDEPLYRAWARAARIGVHDLAMLNELDAIARTPGFATLVESGGELPRVSAEPRAPQADAAPSDPGLAARLREVAFRLDPVAPAAGAAPRSAQSVGEVDTVVHVPLLPPGTDPSRATDARDSLILDRRLLGAGTTAAALFAYPVSDDDERHLRGLAAPGDHVVFGPGGAPTPDRICALRVADRVRLSRVLLSDGLLVLLPGEGGAAFETVPLGDAGLAAVVLGKHVLLVRR